MRPSRRVLVVAAIVLTPFLNLAIGPRAHAAGKKEVPESEPFGRLTVTQVERRLGQPDVHVFDGNRSETYAEHHLPGAVPLNHKDVTTRTLPEDKDATLIFYCMNEL